MMGVVDQKTHQDRRREFKANRLNAWKKFYASGKAERETGELVEVYRPMITGMARRDYNWRGDLEDIIGNGMLGVYEATQKLDIKRVKSVDAYVAMLARSRMIQYVQKMWNRDVNIPDEVLQEKYETFMEKDIDLAMDIEHALDKLPPREQLVLKLRFWSGWQLKEIAELLKCTKVNVWFIEKSALAKVEALANLS